MQHANNDKDLTTFFKVGGLCQENHKALLEAFKLFDAKLPQVTDEFYRLLLEDAQTAPYL